MLKQLGIRTKLVLLFVVIKVIPLVLLALLAWQGISELGSFISRRTGEMSEDVRTTVGELSKMMVSESTRALDLKSREAIERLTTDTALAVAEFLRSRDQDILLAAALEPGAAAYRDFVKYRTGPLYDTGEWQPREDGKAWEPKHPAAGEMLTAISSNEENKQDFNYRPPEQFGKRIDRPLYHEITFVGLDGQEKFKASTSDLLPRELRNVARRDQTYSKAESYFAELARLKPGEIYVSDVIGPYVHSRFYGPVTPQAAEKAKVPFEPEKEAYSGTENPLGKRFQGIIRWATPVVKNGRKIGYVTLALDHSHVMRFTDHLMPTAARYTSVSDATNGNYAFMWDYQDRSIAHPRHQSIVGFDPATGEYETPWLEASIYEGWQASGKTLKEYLADVPLFDHQSREKKPARKLAAAGIRGLDCRYLNFAPQCVGWYDLTKSGGSGSFVILWSGVWKLTTAATIPYFTGQYGKTPRGFGYVTIGANVDEFHKAATDTKILLDHRVDAYGEQMIRTRDETLGQINGYLQSTALSLTASTLVMIAIVVLIAIWLANLLTRRITQVNSGLKRIEAGDLGYRLPGSGNDEMGVLTDSVNRMADSVQESFRRMEEAKIRAEEANRMKSAFLASVSHELRTPLNGILGFTDILKLELENPEQQIYVETIHNSGKHLLDLVNDILDLAKIEAGRMDLDNAPAKLHEIVDRLATLHGAPAQAKGLAIDVRYAPDLPEAIVCDAKRLKQMLNNLLDNAVKFTERGSITINVSKEQDLIRFAVTDTGPGIEPKDCELVFDHFRQAEQFMTRKHGGTGLGLAIARELAALMGGRVELESAVGVGSTFAIVLPIQAP